MSRYAIYLYYLLLQCHSIAKSVLLLYLVVNQSINQEIFNVAKIAISHY